ncbi:hypothetical protein [Streptomyces sp. NPDC015130]|uniref:hypothetical protein n=1 Tax=Streptomyces sp. NPDC015130 TaxID=3364940 RepID=UPI0037035FE4
MSAPKHVCRSGASVYYCPEAGQVESECHGGFDTCCGHPELHEPIVAAKAEGLDARRRYLVPAGVLRLSGEPDHTHLALYTWNARMDGWLVGQGLCGRSVGGTPRFGGPAVACGACVEYLPVYEAALGQEIAGLHARAQDRTARADAGDTVENGAWHTVWLEGRWAWVTKKMTTEQREFAADRVAAYSAFLAAVDGEVERAEPEGLRWWREPS